MTDDEKAEAVIRAFGPPKYTVITMLHSGAYEYGWHTVWRGEEYGLIEASGNSPTPSEEALKWIDVSFRAWWETYGQYL